MPAPADQTSPSTVCSSPTTSLAMGLTCEKSLYRKGNSQSRSPTFSTPSFLSLPA